MKKRTMITLDLALESRKVRRLLATGRMFAVLSFCSMLFFVAIGAVGLAQRQAASEPVSSMKGFAASVSSGFFGNMLEMEMPSFQSAQKSEALSGKQISGLVMRLLTDINPSDPKSLLAVEMPGMQGNSSFLIRKGGGTDPAVGPEDDEPPLPAEEEEPEQEPATPPASSEPPAAESPETTKQPDAGEGESNGGNKDTKNDVVFIYHSHNRESFFPELKEGSKLAESDTKNITLVGKRLADKLEDEGIGTLHSDKDYSTTVDGYNYAYSYKYSKQTVKEAMASDKDLKFFFDIHRDSQKRPHTTTTIDGKDYAQVYFIIGHKNPSWERNEAFAAKIQTELEKKYPGLSRGIYGKTNGNGEYNQSVSPDAVLIEIGGVDNTLAEAYRTADALAEAIAKVYWNDAQEAAAPES